MNKVMCLLIVLLFGLGCATADPNRPVYYRHVKVVPGAVRTVCIQPDPAQPEMALIVKPLEKKLASRGYKIVATPNEAVHTMRLKLKVFDTYLTVSEAKQAAASDYQSTVGPNKNSPRIAPGIGSATGTAVGGAASGSALHAARTPGGLAGGLVWAAC